MSLTLRTFSWPTALLSLTAAALTLLPNSTFAADGTDKQTKLIETLRSDAPPGDKAIACKKLAIYGGKDAVPSLAALLGDADLASWARIALEAIPDPDVDDAFRIAMGKLQGRLLVGTINSIGTRRDPKAVEGLVAKLADADADVASAAAVALGKIGGDAAGKALTQSLASAPEKVRPAVAEGCVRCAEQFLAADKSAEAMAIYDAVRQADLPKHKKLEGVRGAILARKSAGLPLLVEQLRSPDKAYFGIGLRVARELPGRDVTEAIAAEIQRATPEKQVWLFLALADRNDAAVMPAIVQAAKNGPTKLRVAAVGALDRLGSLSAVPVLLSAAVENDKELAQTAKNALGRLPGKEVDADLLGRLVSSSGKAREVLVDLAGQRRIEGSMPIIVKCAEDSDAAVRMAAYKSLGTVGEGAQVEVLVKLIAKNSNAKDRAAMEKALLAICGRCGAKSTPQLLPLMSNSDSALRIVSLHALSSVGGSEALASVKSAVEDKDATVQDEAVRTLSTWPNNWPEDTAVAEPLFALAKNGKSDTHKVLGVRGYLQYIQGDKKLQDEDKVGKIKDFLPLIQRPEEKKLAIVDLGTIHTASSLELLNTFTSEEGTAEEAWTSIINVLDKSVPGVSAETRQKTLQSAEAAVQGDAAKKKAKKLLKAK